MGYPTNSPRNAIVTISVPGGVYASQTITITKEAAIPNDKSIANKTVYNSEIKFYNAFNTITVAGGGTNVEFPNGFTVDLIAGQAISLMPGFHAFEGSLTHAYITTSGTYCYGASGSPISEQPVEKSIVNKSLPETQNIVPMEKSVHVYPNPNNGLFTLDLSNIKSGANVSIYNMPGAIVYQSTTTTEAVQKINLLGIKKGIYIVKVIALNDRLTKKMIVN